jgi:heme-degrading monooxygenase HmoA
MMTIITVVTLARGAEHEWDAAMRERLAEARNHPGWVGGQLLIPLDGLHRRVIIATWETRAHREAWNNDPTFAATRERLRQLEAASQEEWWLEVIDDVPAEPERRLAGIPGPQGIRRSA